MGKSLSPVLRRELQNLDKDVDSRKSAMRALKSYVKDMDSKAIPSFLAQVSETKQSSTSSGEHTISLYEVLARVHGPKIIPQIDNIMSTIVTTLSMCYGGFALHQACSKVVAAIARYAIDPTTAEDKKRHIIHCLCKPLSDCLLGSEDSMSSGVALCLQALVESDNWRFASREMTNEICQRVAGALEKHSQTNSHMALVAALAKHSSQIVDAYARLLLRSGLKILDDGFEEANSQKQLSAIQMINSLIRCLNPKSTVSELEFVIKEMEKCQFGRMPFITRAAFETLQLAKRIWAEKAPKSSTDSATDSNYDRRENERRRLVNSRNQPPFAASPESHSVNSSVGYNYNAESPYSMNLGHQGSDFAHSMNCRLWQRFENGGLDVSLKDGIFSAMTQEGDFMSCEYDNENFTGFVQGVEIEDMRSKTPSPQRSNGCINVDDVRIFTTPRKLICSLQEQPDNFNSGYSQRQAKMFTSPTRSTFAQTPILLHEHAITKCDNCDQDHNTRHFHGISESISSTEDMLGNDRDLSSEVALEVDVKEKSSKNYARSIGCSICAAIFATALWWMLAMVNQDDLFVPIPT